MKFKSFKQHLAGKSVVKADGDRLAVENPPNKPPQGGKPYKSSDGKPRTSKEKGFGDLGDTKYEPDVKDVHGKKGAKIPTAEQIQAANAIVTIIGNDPTFVENMVRALKERGLLGALVAETFQHSESYRHLADIMGHDTYGPKACSKLVEAMNEEVAPSYSSQLGQEQSEEEDFQDDDDDEDKDDEGLSGEENMDPNMDMDMNLDDPNADPMMDGPPGAPPGMPMGVPPGAAPGMPPMPMGAPPAPPMPGAMTNFQRAMMRQMMRK